MTRTRLKPLVFLALAAWVLPGALIAQERPVADQVRELVARLDQASPDGVWDLALELEAIGPGAVSEVARAVAAAHGGTRLALAKVLLAMDGVEDEPRGVAVQALRDAIRAEADRGLRVKACELLARFGRRSEVRPLKRDLEAITDPYVKISLLKVLRLRARDREADQGLREFLKSEDAGVRSEAALTLAEVGNVEAAKPVLSRLKDEPTERGRRAAALLELEDLLAKVERYGGLEDTNQILEQRNKRIESLEGELERLRGELRSGTGGEAGPQVPGSKLFQELFDLIKEGYVDEGKTKLDDLIDHAASGIVDTLDPFSAYMNEETLTRFDEDLHQQYGGIGAVVQIDRKSGFLTIQRPIYGNPAHKAGMRTLDRVTEVEGQTTKGKTVTDLVKILKGVPGTPVTLKVIPFLGPQEERVLQVTRQQVTLNSVRYDLLPGGMGYVQLTQFGSFASREIEEALADLEKRGMRGLIFDLRGNPGGLLSAAVEVADKFLNDDQLVVYSQGRGARYGTRQDDGGPAVAHRRRLQAKHPDYPLIVLIDEHSASASEIVSGALQAHKRAELVGQQTFGKGSVQNVFKLESMNGKAALRMTVAYYYLPDGRCIHRERDVEGWKFSERMRMEIERWKQDGEINETQAADLLKQYQPAPGGVSPDYAVELPDYPAEKQRAFGQILELQLLEEYIQANWLANKEAFHALAISDGFDPSRYPGFDALWTKVQESLDQTSRGAIDKNDVRLLLRSTVRRFAQDDLARELTSDYQEDRQLQAALLVLSQRLGQDLAQLPELSFIPTRFPEGLTRAEPVKPAPAPEGGEKPPEGEKPQQPRDFKK